MELEDELDPILFINKMVYQSHQVLFLTTMLGSLVVYDLDTSSLVSQFRVNSAVNCLGSIQRSSGFRLGTTLLQIGNLNTPALSDSKCVLYALNLPCILRLKMPPQEP